MNECVFIQKGNMIFTDMLTGKQYDVQEGDRFYMPRGTIYASMTHQGASYFWCSKKAAPDGQGTNQWPSNENDSQQETLEE